MEINKYLCILLYITYTSLLKSIAKNLWFNMHPVVIHHIGLFFGKNHKEDMISIHYKQMIRVACGT